MRALNIRKFVMSAIVGIGLALVLGAQGLAGALAKSSSPTASALAPGNGIALEERAFDMFTSHVKRPDELTEPARRAQTLARAALAADPLAPKAHAIMVMAAQDEGQRLQLRSAASTLNRRNRSLQGLALADHLSANDYAATLETLDQMLRINARNREILFPVLVQALNQSGTEELFVSMLDFTAPWHKDFLRVAADDANARVVIAGIRADLPIVDPELDRRLIARLAAQGELDLALQLYQGQSVSGSAAQGDTVSPWKAEFPPFDWALTEEAQLRAQPSRDGSKLEIFARAGEGGPVAQKIVDRVSQRLEITTALQSDSPEGSGSVRLDVTCAATGAEVVSEPLLDGSNRFAIDPSGPDCGQLRLTIHARSRLGAPALRADIDAIALTAR